MVKVTYVEASGAEHVIDVAVGTTLMEGAVKNGVPGIAADCGGACACATCRVYIDAQWQEKTGPASDIEKPMIEYSEDPDSRVRLSCQIVASDELGGIVVHMPASQH